MRSSAIVDTGRPAFDVRVPDERLRVYMQTQTFAGEQSPDGFRDSVAAFRRHLAVRPRAASPDPLGRLVLLDRQDDGPAVDFRAAVQGYFDRLGYGRERSAALFNDLYWKVAALPEGPRRILSIGCGGGAELILLRARYPDAEITALDYVMYVDGGQATLDLLRVRFVEGNLFDNIAALGSDFDLVFSNHVIEHFYEPDDEIRSIVAHLRPGGVFSAGLPLDAQVFSDLLRDLARDPSRIHPLDMNWLDVRHPWKTHAADLAATLKGAGLGEIVVHQREWHAGRERAGSLEDLQRRETQAGRVYAVTIGLAKGVLKGMFADPPRRLARLLFAVDRRLWFGRYRLKCDVQPEAFVVARRSA